MSTWTANTFTPVAQDGSIGSATYKALQFGLGFTGSAVDGIFLKNSVTKLQEALNGHTLPANNPNPGMTVQVDGNWGQETSTALQHVLGVTPDGVFGYNSTLALQYGLNQGHFGNPVPATATGARSPIPVSSVTYDHYTGSGTVTDWINQGMAIAGVSGSAWSTGLNVIAQHESSGNPNVANGYDLNAVGAIQSDGYPAQSSRGLMQDIPQTFADNHASGTSNSIYNPIAGVAASVYYILRTYGNINNVPGVVAVANGRPYVGY